MLNNIFWQQAEEIGMTSSSSTSLSFFAGFSPLKQSYIYHVNRQSRGNTLNLQPLRVLALITKRGFRSESVWGTKELYGKFGESFLCCEVSQGNISVEEIYLILNNFLNR